MSTTKPIPPAEATARFSYQFNPFNARGRVQITFDGIAIAESQTIKSAGQLCTILNEAPLLEAVADVAKRFLVSNSTNGHVSICECYRCDLKRAVNAFVYGQWDKDKKRILLSRSCLKKGRHFLAATLLEEIFHRDSGFVDHSREFQNYIFEHLINALAQSKGEYL